MSKQALLIVDVQNDLCPGGSLAIPQGDDVVQPLARYIDLFNQAGVLICATRDWHPTRAKLFVTCGGTWPVHCVQHSPGAAFHPDLELPPGAELISKGMNPDDQDHSCFRGVSLDGTPFGDLLRSQGVQELFVGGLAADYGVKATVMDALKLKFNVTVLLDAIRGVDRQPGDVDRAVREMERAGAVLGTFETVHPRVGTFR